MEDVPEKDDSPMMRQKNIEQSWHKTEINHSLHSRPVGADVYHEFFIQFRMTQLPVG